MSKTNKRVAVLGSTAFSATDFIDLLLEEGGYDILGISRSPESGPVMLPHLRHGPDHYEFKQIHMVDEMDRVIAALDDFRPDYVVNFAAQGEVPSSFEHPEAHFRTNTLAMVELTNALRQRDWLTRYVHISTPEVYGSCAGGVSEDQPMNPSSPYAASKGAADMFMNILYKTYGFPVVWIRGTNVYGPHQQLYRIIPRTAIYIKLGRTLRLDGGGVAVKSFIHIRDSSRGTKLAMEQGEDGLIYHLAPDRGRTVREVVEMVCHKMAADFDTVVEMGPERTGQDKAYVLDSTRAETTLGWQPTISFDDGVGGVIDWINDNWAEISKMDLGYEFKA